MHYTKYAQDGSIAMAADWPFPGSQPVDFEVERGYDGKLYKAGEAPVKSEAEVEEERVAARKAEILAELERIDRAGARSARAVALALLMGETPDAGDAAKLLEHETNAKALRENLSALMPLTASEMD